MSIKLTIENFTLTFKILGFSAVADVKTPESRKR